MTIRRFRSGQPADFGDVPKAQRTPDADLPTSPPSKTKRQVGFEAHVEPAPPVEIQAPEPRGHVSLPSLDFSEKQTFSRIPNNCGWYALGFLKNMSAEQAAAVAGEKQGPLVAALLTMPDPIMSSLGLVPRDVQTATDWGDVLAKLNDMPDGRFLLVIRFPTGSMPDGTPPSHVMVAEKKDGAISVIDPSRHLEDAEAITFGRQDRTLLPIADAMMIRVDDIEPRR